MQAISLWLAAAIVILTGWAIVKKYQVNMVLFIAGLLPTLAADSGFFHLEARIHRAFQNFKIYVGVATTFVSGKCSFLLKAEGASTRLRASKLNNADIRSNKPAS